MHRKESYYFSHDANARRDPKIVKMSCKYKYGYQWYFMIIEILREQTNFKYKIDTYTFAAIAKELAEPIEVIQDFIKDCINEFELFASDNISFWSNSLLRRMRIKEEISRKNSKNAKKRWNNKALTFDATAMPSHTDRNALKEKKVNKNKKENKDSDTASPDQQFSFPDSEKHSLIIWAEQNAPRIFQMKEPLTSDQCKQLVNDYPLDIIEKKLLAMQNYKPLIKNNLNSNLTLRNWINKDGTSKTPQSNYQQQSGNNYSSSKSQFKYFNPDESTADAVSNNKAS